MNSGRFLVGKERVAGDCIKVGPAMLGTRESPASTKGQRRRS